MKPKILGLIHIKQIFMLKLYSFCMSLEQAFSFRKLTGLLDKQQKSLVNILATTP